jgi:hypothetical protein
MALPSPNFRLDKQGLMPDYDRVMAPVPLRRGQPVMGYGGFTYRIDGTVAASQWSCMCGGSPAAQAYGIKDPENAIVDPTRAYFAEVNCVGGAPGACTDPAALTYNVNSQVGEHLACVYPNALARESCTEARTPATGCNMIPYRHSHA